MHCKKIALAEGEKHERLVHMSSLAQCINSQEQAKIAKLGLEMKLLTSEMDAETEKWPAAENDIVGRARAMSQMAFSMYQFTRGEGDLKTTQARSSIRTADPLGQKY